jgi:hypothetical protein
MKSGKDDEVAFAYSLILLTVYATRIKGGLQKVYLHITEIIVKY